jgi:hypothetical protein
MNKFMHRKTRNASRRFPRTRSAAAAVREMHEATARLEESHRQHKAAKLATQHEAQGAKVGQHDAAQTIQPQNKALVGEKYCPPEPQKVIPLVEQGSPKHEVQHIASY